VGRGTREAFARAYRGRIITSCRRHHQYDLPRIRNVRALGQDLRARAAGPRAIRGQRAGARAVGWKASQSRCRLRAYTRRTILAEMGAGRRSPPRAIPRRRPGAGGAPRRGGGQGQGRPRRPRPPRAPPAARRRLSPARPRSSSERARRATARRRTPDRRPARALPAAPPDGDRHPGRCASRATSACSGPGQTISAFGNMATFVAVPFQSYQLTGSALQVGLLSICDAVPLLLFAAIGGTIADPPRSAENRPLDRTSGLWAARPCWRCERLQWSAARVGVATCSRSSPRRSGARRALGPARADWPGLVPEEQLAASQALQSVYGQTASIVGPALGGVLIAATGVGWAYVIDRRDLHSSTRHRAADRSPPCRRRGRASGARLAVREGCAFSAASL